MIINNNFVFLHMQKTGGAFTSDTLSEIFPGTEILNSHSPRIDIPMQFQHLPCIGFVRNPWDWYVSWYSFFKGKTYTTPIFGAVSDNKKLGFKQTIKNLFDLICSELDQGIVNSEINAHFETGKKVTTISQRINSGALSTVTGGLYSCMFEHMFALNGSYEDVLFGKVENLREDLIEILNKVNCNLNSKQKDIILTNKSVNQSQRGSYRGYYDDELRELVQCRESEIIKKFEYEF